jgi:glutamate N-acetyltransferase / amino-acid N-acetyltransferase
VDLGAEGLQRLDAALRIGLLRMALAVVADGEGTTITVRLHVRGGTDDAEAERVARAIGDSPLVKASVYGHDPNWGRIVSAAGMSLPAEAAGSFACDVDYGEFRVLDHGEPVCFSLEDQDCLDEACTGPELDIAVHLHRGAGEAVLYFPDLTHDYVQLNAGGRT